jgi:hypothetical protein
VLAELGEDPLRRVLALGDATVRDLRSLGVLGRTSSAKLSTAPEGLIVLL